VGQRNRCSRKDIILKEYSMYPEFHVPGKPAWAVHGTTCPHFRRRIRRASKVLGSRFPGPPFPCGLCVTSASMFFLTNNVRRVFSIVPRNRQLAYILANTPRLPPFGRPRPYCETCSFYLMLKIGRIRTHRKHFMSQISHRECCGPRSLAGERSRG